MKSMAISVCVLSAFAIPAFAQSSGPTSSPMTADKNLVGAWEGPYSADHGPPGSIRLTIVRDSTWKASMELVAGGEPVPTTIRDFRVDGNSVSWTQELM